MNRLDMNAAEQDFGRFFPDEARLQAYLLRIRSCQTLSEVEDRVVIPMVREGYVDVQTIALSRFYGRLIPLLGHIRRVSPTTVYNHMVALARVLARQNRRPAAESPSWSAPLAMPAPAEGERVEMRFALIATRLRGADELTLSLVHLDTKTGPVGQGLCPVPRGRSLSRRCKYSREAA